MFLNPPLIKKQLTWNPLSHTKTNKPPIQNVIENHHITHYFSSIQFPRYTRTVLNFYWIRAIYSVVTERVDYEKKSSELSAPTQCPEKFSDIFFSPCWKTWAYIYKLSIERASGVRVFVLGALCGLKIYIVFSALLPYLLLSAPPHLDANTLRFYYV